MGKEIERKFLVKEIPDLNAYPYKCLEQGYLSVNPVVRVRKEDDTYYLTYKGKGFLEREEYNLPHNEDSYNHLVAKTDGKIIRKKRYLIPYENHTIELDIFEGELAPLILAEVEFESVEEATSFVPPSWFGEDVTGNKNYTNASLALN